MQEPCEVLKPPISVIERIDRLFNNFLWEGSAGTKKIHWASWHKITLPSNEEGLDIRSLGDVLKAFSMKLWWSRFPSFASSTTRVHYFYDNGKWDMGKLNDVLPEDVVAEILKISIDLPSDDRAYWVPTSDGQFTIKSAWEIVRQRQSVVPHPPKIFSWHKPSAGEFKLNVGGSSKHNRQNAAGGGLLRDHTSTMIFGVSENFGPCDSLQAELMALHRGFLLCIEHNVSRL
ncbi:Ribonuclease H domain - like 10 [Theobroma cacao]|nr:Ribonuclease H domain - like 10 [Theobroma cacao]